MTIADQVSYVAPGLLFIIFKSLNYKISIQILWEMSIDLMKSVTAGVHKLLLKDTRLHKSSRINSAKFQPKTHPANKA